MKTFLKILYRIAIILVAALVVVSAAVILTSNGQGAALSIGNGEQHGVMNGERPTLPDGFSGGEFGGRGPAAGGLRGDHHGSAAGSLNWTVWAKNLGTIGVIVLAVIGVERVFDWVKQWRRRRGAARAASPVIAPPDAPLPASPAEPDDLPPPTE